MNDEGANVQPKSFRIAMLVALVSVAAHVNTIFNDYCYDDPLIVRDSALVNEPGKWLDVWTADYWAVHSDWSRRDLLYRPLTVTSFRAVRQFFGPSPMPQHAVNVLLHALVATMVFFLTKRVAAAIELPLPGRESAGVRVTPLFAGLLFAVLPIHVDAVAPIVGRADLLAAAFTLCALLVIDKPSPHAKFAAAAGVFLAMCSKESGIAAIPILLAWMWLLNSQSCQNSTKAMHVQPHPPLPRGDTGGVSFKRTKFKYFTLFALPFIAYLLLRFNALGVLFQQPAPTKTINALVDAPTWQRILAVFQLLGMYLHKTLWPDVLCISYAINAVRPATSLLNGHVLFGGSALALALLASAIAWHRNNKAIAFLVAAVLLAYLPTANALVLIQVFFAERIWYLPSVFLCILLALAASRALRVRLARIVIAFILLAMLVRSGARNSEWRDNGTLYASCYRDHPESISCLNLFGTWLTEKGQIERGVEMLSRAIEMDLGYTDAHRALGLAYARLEDWPAAARHLQTADMQVPGNAEIVAALAAANARLRANAGDRIAQLQATADAASTDVVAELSLIRVLIDTGQRKEALQRFAEKEEAFVSAAEWHHEYAVTLVLLDRRDDAIERYKKALAISHLPPLPRGDQGGFVSHAQPARISVELAMLLIERRGPSDLETAETLCTSATSAAPTDPAPLICIAELQSLQGQLTRAQQSYQRAINLLPPNHPQRRILEQRAKTLGN